MTRKIYSKLPLKKVEMSDVVSPNPSRSARRVLKVALIKSYDRQTAISKEAASLKVSY